MPEHELTGKRATAFRAAQVVLARTVTTRKVVADVCGVESAGNERINDLRRAGIVRVTPTQFGHADGLQLHPDLGFTIGVDVAHDQLSVTAADTSLHPLLQHPAVSSRADLAVDAAGALDEIADLVVSVIKQTGRAIDELIGIGVGMPGPVERPSGKMSRATHVLSGWWDLEPAKELRRRLTRPLGLAPEIAVENDATLGALGIFISGVLEAAKLEDVDEDLIYVHMGSGIGGGIVTAGRPVTGGSGFAGEIGHVKVDDHGPLCPRCGQRGCVETKAAASFVIEQVDGKGIVRFPVAATNAEKIALMVDSPHPACARALANAGLHVGTALAVACTLLDPDRVFVGGTMAQSPQYVAALERALYDNATATVGQRSRDAQRSRRFVVSIDPSTFHDPRMGEPELLGALVLPLRKFASRYIRRRVIERIAAGEPEAVRASRPH